MKRERARRDPNPSGFKSAALIAEIHSVSVSELFPRSRYRQLLQDENFSSWVENVARGSKVTAEVYLRRVGRICSLLGTTQCDLAGLSKKEAGDLLIRAVSSLEKEGNRGSTIAGYVKSLKSWWFFNDIEVTKPIRLSRNEGLYDNERIPSHQELHSILEHADLQKKVCCALMAFSGVRPQVLGNRDANDGLRVSDLPELVIKGKEVEFLKTPAVVTVRKGISKGRHQYTTFLPEQGCLHVKQYLEWRMRVLREKLSPDSPIITADPWNRAYVGRFIRVTNISDAVRSAIRAAGFGWRPYVLRRYFDTRMMGAEQDGTIIKDYRVFWMGHIGDIEHVYTLNKGQLPADLLEKMREGYAKAAESYLVTTLKESMGRDMVLSTINRKLLEFAGCGKEEIDGMGDLSKLSSQEVQELVRKKATEALGLNSNSQKVVPMSQVKLHIQEGWEFVSSLPNEEAVIRLPRPGLPVQ